MISAQDLIEKITSAANCDDCIVVVKDKTQANLRWAGSTLTTNGVIQERSVTVVAFVAVTGGMASGGVTRTDVSLADIPALLEDAIASAKAAGPADDYSPLATNVAIGNWAAEHIPNCRFMEIPSRWGHQSASFADSESVKFLGQSINSFLWESTCV